MFDWEGIYQALVSNGHGNKLKEAGIILAIFVFIATFIHIFFYKLLKVLTKFTKTDLDDKIRRILRFPIFLTIITSGLLAAYSHSGIYQGSSEIIVNLFHSIFVIIWLITVFKLIKTVLDYYGAHTKKFKMGGLSRKMLPFFEKIIGAVFVLIAILVLMKIWTLDISPLIASAGIAGIAIAFAAKDTISNVFGGIFIFFDKTYVIGSYVLIDDKYRGEVIDMGLRTTKIKTRDDVELTIPNSIMANSVVVNESGGHKGRLRVRMKLGIQYGEDIGKMEKILKQIAAKAEWVEDKPEPRLRFREMGNSALEFEFLFWVKDPELRGRALSQMNHLVYDVFRKKKVKFGYVSEHYVNWHKV
ncbi:MAG: Large-conductance mechanosensitive channel MscMJLR [Candidatus Woesearchaeota archaeon]|nr:Large-conductance mechanosensitive channel MscMJLR [Candidatus Woesearchaeota archaeon]